MKIEQNICYFIWTNGVMYLRLGPKEWCEATASGWRNISDYSAKELEIGFVTQRIKDIDSDKDA